MVATRLLPSPMSSPPLQYAQTSSQAVGVPWGQQALCFYLTSVFASQIFPLSCLPQGLGKWGEKQCSLILKAGENKLTVLAAKGIPERGLHMVS